MGKLKEALESLAKDYQMTIWREMSANKLNASGRLKDSIKYDVSEDGFTIESKEFHSFLLGEDGRRRGTQPSTDVILSWMKSKGIRPIRRLKGGVKFSRMNTDKRSAEKSAAFAIAKSIKSNGTIKRFLQKHGTGGSNIIKDATERMVAKGYEPIMDAYKQDLVEKMKQEFKFDNIKIQ